MNELLYGKLKDNGKKFLNVSRMNKLFFSIKLGQNANFENEKISCYQKEKNRRMKFNSVRKKRTHNDE
jgi:hypothetical protein